MAKTPSKRTRSGKSVSECPLQQPCPVSTDLADCMREISGILQQYDKRMQEGFQNVHSALSKVDSRFETIDVRFAATDKSIKDSCDSMRDVAGSLTAKYEDVSEKLAINSTVVERLSTQWELMSKKVDKLDAFLFNGDTVADSLVSQITALRTNQRFLDRGLTIIVGIAASVVTTLIIFILQWAFVNDGQHVNSFGSEPVVVSPIE